MLLPAAPAAGLAGVRVEAPRIAIERGSGDVYDLNVELPRVVIRRGATADAERIEIHKGSLEWRDPAVAAPEPRAARISFQVELRRRFADWVGEAVLALDEGRLALGFVEAGAPARLVTGLVLGESGPALRGARLEAARLRVERVRGRRVEARFDFSERAFRIEILHFDWFDGTWFAAGTVSLADARFEGNVRATRTDLNDLIPAVLGTEAETDLGGLTLNARLRGDWSDPERWLESLAGRGYLGVEGGTLPSFSLFRTIWRALFDRVPGVEAVKLHREDAAPTRLVRVSHPFTLADGVLRSDAVAIETDDYGAKGSGSLGLDGSADYSLVFRFTPQGARKVFSMAHARFPMGAVQLTPIPLALGGTLAEPRFRADVSAVSVRNLLALLGEVEGVSKALGDLVSSPIQKGADLLERGTEKVLDPGARDGRR